ncbi:MAG: YraN family protein [Burkholderiaceae bacterium]|nr:YraN family protein [Burkholderiaceae bacterium]
MGATGRQLHGQAGEDRALDYLSGHGLKLVERNFRCKVGEIDLVMNHQGCLVFVEVRRRESLAHGGALASVTPAKQRRMVRAAQWYLKRYLQRYRQMPPCRFDVVAIDGDSLNWLRNAIVEGM